MLRRIDFWGPSLMESVALILAGALILIEPAMTSLLMANLLALLGFAYGIYMIARWFADRKKGYDSIADLLLGASLSVVSVAVYLNPAWVLASLPMVAGIGMIVNGFSKISSAIQVKKAGGSVWGPLLAIVLPVLMGSFLLFFPIASFEGFVMLAGTFISMIGFFDLFSIFLINRSLHDLQVL